MTLFMKQHVLITGASRGIGLALAKQFLNNGFAVTGAARSSEYSDLHYSDLKVIQLDLSKSESIEAAVQELRAGGIHFDMLINNAGVGPDLDTAAPDFISYEQTFAVNTQGTVFFTEAMLPLMKKGGKIINISSKMGSVGLCTGTDATAYRMSKAALNMYTRTLAGRVYGKQIVAAVHPGWVRTTLTASNVHGRLSPEQSAQRIYDFAVSDFETDTFWNAETEDICPW
jgi:NAD(P)-dependent dehydrogenase (short-subunit alcohol dehydrogenase family)